MSENKSGFRLEKENVEKVIKSFSRWNLAEEIIWSIAKREYFDNPAAAFGSATEAVEDFKCRIWNSGAVGI